MANNHSKLLGMYDKLSTFLAQISVSEDKGCVTPMNSILFCLFTLQNLGHVQLARITQKFEKNILRCT